MLNAIYMEVLLVEALDVRRELQSFRLAASPGSLSIVAPAYITALCVGETFGSRAWSYCSTLPSPTHNPQQHGSRLLIQESTSGAHLICKI